MNKNTRNKEQGTVNNFPTNFLKSITFLHPTGVCGWNFYQTAKMKSKEKWPSKSGLRYLIR